MKLYAEVIQDTNQNPYTILDTQTVALELPELKVVLPSLPDFYMIQNDSSNTGAADSGETRVYELASMNIPYGITGRDAFVSTPKFRSKCPLLTFKNGAKKGQNEKIESRKQRP